MAPQISTLFDKILQERIGFGTYQLQAFFSFAFIDFLDGIDVVCMSVILPILQ
jgi:hypothetical protein